MRQLIAGLALVALLAPVALGGDGNDGWERIYDKDGIVVFQRNVEGVSTISIRGEATIDASVADIADTMKDNATAGDWMPNIKAKKDLKAISATERIEYTHVGMPWPITDRYFVNQGKAEYLPGGVLRLSVKSVKDFEYKEDDKILGELLYSEFVLTPLDNGRRTHMTLEVNTDPKGMIPKWIVNFAQRSWPRKFFEGLIKQLDKNGKLVKATIDVAH